MTPVLPVWATTKEILSYCWSKRALAIRYAIPPVAALLVIDIGGIFAGIDTEKNVWWAIVTIALALLAFAPFTVTWFQSIVSGEAEARKRPVVGFTYLEKNVLLANVRVLAFLVAISLLLFVVFLGGAVLHALGLPNWLEYGVIGIVGAAALYFWTMALTRVSMVIAYGAAGEPIRIRESFRLTRPMAYRMTWIHIIISTLLLVVAYPISSALGYAEDVKNIPTSIALAVIGAISGMLYLIFVTTLFGFVYRRLKETA